MRASSLRQAALGLAALFMVSLPVVARAGDVVRVDVVRGRVVDLDGRPVVRARVVIATSERPTGGDLDRGERAASDLDGHRHRRDAVFEAYVTTRAFPDAGGDPLRLLERARASAIGRGIYDLTVAETRDDGSFQVRVDRDFKVFSVVTASATSADESTWGMSGVMVTRPEVTMRGLLRMVAYEVNFPSEVHDGALDVGLVLARPVARLRVSVRRHGVPLGGEFVYIRRPGIGSSYDDVLVETDDTGWADACLPAGRVFVAALRSGKPRYRLLSLDAHAGSQTLDLELLERSSTPLPGRVVNADGLPVSLAVVYAYPGERAGTSSDMLGPSLAWVRCDAAGNFVFDDLPEGPVVLVACVPGTFSRSGAVRAAPGSPAVVALKPEGTVEVEVPPGIAEVYVSRPRTGTDELPTPSEGGNVRNLADRRLRWDLPIGNIQIVGDEYPSTVIATQTLRVERGQVTRAAFEPSIVVRGRVVNPEGEGRFAALFCRPGVGGGQHMLAVTESDGTFVVKVPAGFEIRAERSGFWTSVESVDQHSPWVRASNGAAELRLEPPPPWAIGPSLTEQYLQR